MADQLIAGPCLSDSQVVHELLTVWKGDVIPPGGWRRIAWNFCWRFGAGRDFPLPAEATAELKHRLRDELVLREAPASQVDALVVWGVKRYHRHRSSHIYKTLFPPSKDIRPNPFLVVGDLPPSMRAPDGRGQFRPLVQYAKDWGARPYDRHQMMADPPPEDTEEGIAVSIATAVHALCDLDEITPPDWVFEYRCQTPMWAWDLGGPIQDNEYDQMLVAHAPPACHYHNLYFDQSFIECYLWLNPPPRRRRTRRPVQVKERELVSV